MALDLRKFKEYTTDGLIGALVDVTTLLIAALEKQADRQSQYDRTYINRYQISEESSHAARDADARYVSQELHDELMAITNQVQIHTTVAKFLNDLITWRTSATE